MGLNLKPVSIALHCLLMGYIWALGTKWDRKKLDETPPPPVASCEMTLTSVGLVSLRSLQISRGCITGSVQGEMGAYGEQSEADRDQRGSAGCVYIKVWSKPSHCCKNIHCKTETQCLLVLNINTSALWGRGWGTVVIVSLLCLQKTITSDSDVVSRPSL